MVIKAPKMPRINLSRVQDSSSHFATQVQQVIGSQSRAVRHRLRRKPLCFKILQGVYHKYGLKHVLLLVILILYACTWAVMFVLFERPHEMAETEKWREKIAANRSKFVTQLVKEVFNNTVYYCRLSADRSRNVAEHFGRAVQSYEHGLGIKYGSHRIQWDYWNAVLFVGTVCTTIGYGYNFPRTAAGRVLTMICALGGIPLVLLVMQDLGRLLTVFMKYPWFQFKRIFRRSLRYCTKQSMVEIGRIEKEERQELAVFDLPIPVAVALVVGWVFLGAVCFSMWDKNWSYLDAFYFFFISLSTVGLGDLLPTQPRLLLMMFGYIIIGLSLVSMVVNLLLTNMRKTYEAGQSDSEDGSPLAESTPNVAGPSVMTTLGILHGYEGPEKVDEFLTASGKLQRRRSVRRRSSRRSRASSVRMSDDLKPMEEKQKKDTVSTLVQTDISCPILKQEFFQLFLSEDGSNSIRRPTTTAPRSASLPAQAYVAKSPDEVSDLVMKNDPEIEHMLSASEEILEADVLQENGVLIEEEEESVEQVADEENIETNYFCEEYFL